MITKFIRKKSGTIGVLLTIALSSSIYAKNNLKFKISENNIKASNIEGKELFKGIMFYSGKAADLTEISKQQKKIMDKLNPNLKENYSLLQEQIIKILEAKNPNYFTDFKKNITSGNHYLVLNTIKNSSNDLKEVTAKLYNIDISGNMNDLTKKALNNSKYAKIQNTDGTINIDELNKAYNESSVDSTSALAPPETLLAIVLVVALAFFWVWEHNIAEVTNGNNIVLKSTFESERYVNQIVKNIK